MTDLSLVCRIENRSIRIQIDGVTGIGKIKVAEAISELLKSQGLNTRISDGKHLLVYVYRDFLQVTEPPYGS